MDLTNTAANPGVIRKSEEANTKLIAALEAYLSDGQEHQFDVEAYSLLADMAPRHPIVLKAEAAE